MEDILFYQNYQVAGDIMAVVICIATLFLLNSAYAVKGKNLVVFKRAIILCLLASWTSMGYHMMVQNITSKNVIGIYICRATSYICLIWVYVCFFIYIRNIVGLRKSFAMAMNFSIIGVAALVSLWILLTPVTKLGFYIDENLVVHQNYYTDIFRYIYSYFSVSVITLLLAYRKNFIGKMFRCICCVMSLSFLLMVIQDHFMNTSFICASFTLPIFMVLFLYHHNSYEVETGMLDHHAFDAYIRDMQKKNFSAIFVSFPDLTYEKLSDLSTHLFRFNDKYLMDSCSFRLRDNKMVLVYQKERNKNYEKTLGELYDAFMEMFEEKHNDFRMVLMDSVSELNYGEDYIALCEYLERHMPINTVYTCEAVDIKGFLQMKKILRELQDIYTKDDLNDERVKVYCQPVLNTRIGKFTTAEALMRLELPEIGLVYPDQFIGMAERHGYIHVLSKIILHKTCGHIRYFMEHGYEIDRISINFSMQELHMASFSRDITEIIEANGVPFEKIAVELTESRNEKDFKRVKSIIKELQGLGIKFYLDDFGTGYSNFERIIGLPIDIIKFDRSLTILASKNDESRFMVGSFSEIFKKADYQILFEGVEDENDENQCIDMDAMYLQGYKYSKPIPIEQLDSFLEKVA